MKSESETARVDAQAATSEARYLVKHLEIAVDELTDEIAALRKGLGDALDELFAQWLADNPGNENPPSALLAIEDWLER